MKQRTGTYKLKEMKVGKQMGRPTEATSKRLFALSGNQCAFDDCRAVLVEQAANSIGEICHIRAQRETGARFDPSYPPEKLHSFENLLVLCPTHHTKIDSQSELYTVELLERMKADHEDKSGRPERLEDIFSARILLGIYDRIAMPENQGNIVIGSPGAIITQTINVTTGRKKAAPPPPACTIGADSNAARYIKHLIQRYNAFASQNLDRADKFRYGVISANIETRFGSAWNYLPLEDFDDLVDYLQGRINRTIIGERNTAKGHPSFSSFAEFSQPRRGKPKSNP